MAYIRLEVDVKWSPVLLLAPSLLVLIGSDCSTTYGPAKYGSDQVEITSVSSDRLCDDPAGAKVVIEGTYTITCTDEDQCGRDHGETFTVPFTLDGSAAHVETTLSNGDPVAVWADCSELTADLVGDHAVDGPGRDIGGLSPDCTVIFDGKSAAELTDYTLRVDWVSHNLTDELVCPGEPPFGVLELETLVAEVPACENNALFTLKGTGSVLCRGSDSCTAGERLSFDYELGQEQTTPEITLSNGEKLHLPYSCIDANVSVWGMLAGQRRRLGTLNGSCVLIADDAELAEATELTVEGNFGWLPELQMEQDCPPK